MESDVKELCSEVVISPFDAAPAPSTKNSVHRLEEHHEQESPLESVRRAAHEVVRPMTFAVVIPPQSDEDRDAERM